MDGALLLDEEGSSCCCCCCSAMQWERESFCWSCQKKVLGCGPPSSINNHYHSYKLGPRSIFSHKMVLTFVKFVLLQCDWNATDQIQNFLGPVLLKLMSHLRTNLRVFYLLKIFKNTLTYTEKNYMVTHQMLVKLGPTTIYANPVFRVVCYLG